MSSSVPTVGMGEAKSNFSKLTANAMILPVTALKNNRPLVEMRPSAMPRNDLKGMPSATIEAVQETEDMLADRTHMTYASANDLFAALGL